MAITTNITSILNQKRRGLDARNAIVATEANTLTKRAVKRAIQETKNAFMVNPIPCIYYKRLNHGRVCSCKEESRKSDYENNSKITGISLSDFLVNVPQLIPNDEVCPICFNTFFVGGYERIGCITQVLDYTNHFQTNKVNVIKEKPYWFSLPTSKVGEITWKVKIPKYFKDIEDLAIRWKEEPAEWDLLIDRESLDKEILFDKKGKEVTIKLQMKDGSSQNIGVYGIFIIYSISEHCLIPSDFPDMTFSGTGEMNIVNEPSSPQSVYFPNQVFKVDTTDLFIDTRWNRLWRVIEVVYKSPMKDVDPIYFETQSRIVRDWELYYSLPNKRIRGIYKSTELYSFVI